MSRKRNLFIICLVLLGVVIAFVLWSHKSTNVKLVMSPSSAKAIIDGKTKVTPGNFTITPGTHTITATFSGFATYKKTFTTSKSGVTNLTLVLIPNTQAGTDYLANNPSEETLREGIVGSTFSQTNDARLKANPIISLLPFVGPATEYRIDYGTPDDDSNDSSTKVAIYITFYTTDGKQDALNWIQQNGYDPASLSIIYQDKTDQQETTNNPYTD